MAPIVRMPAVVFQRENSELIWNQPVIDCERKTKHQVAADILFYHPPAEGIFKNFAYRDVQTVQKLSAKGRHTPLVVPRSFDQLRFRLGMITQLHFTARRAVSITSACDRPLAAPDEISASRRIDSVMAEASSVSFNPVSRLSQRA